MKFLLPLIFLVACSTTTEKSPTKSADKVSNNQFKKEKPLLSSQVPDYYKTGVASLNPALQDETLDRYSTNEISNLKSNDDVLLEISLKCTQSEFKEAFQLASAHYNRYQKIPAYWNQVANCHLNSGSHRKALLFYNKALEVGPNYVPALNNIGVMYSRQGQDQKALIAFERANKQSRFSKTPRYNLARLYLTYGLTDLALPIFQSLLNESPKDVDLLNAVGTSHFLLSDFTRSLSFYQVIPQKEWKRAEIGLNLSLALNKLGKKKEALKVLESIEAPKTAKLKNYFKSIKAQLGEAE